MPLKAIIFDVDGTLVDSVDLHARAWQDAFAEFGKTTDFAHVRSQIGKGSDTLMPAFLSETEVERLGETLSERRSEIFKERYLSQVRPFPRVRDLFERLHQDGVKTVLASSGKKDEVAHHQKLCRIEDLVDAETSSDDAEKSKPYPDIFEAALKRLPGVDAAEALAVGDTPYDAEAAGKVKLRTIGLLCGGFSEDSLRQAGASALYQDVADLLARYAESPFAPATR
jgi:HAD superfamily hydrolase (TIGR01509 family)